jgi:hypothetical protein
MTACPPVTDWLWETLVFFQNILKIFSNKRKGGLRQVRAGGIRMLARFQFQQGNHEHQLDAA